MSKQLSSGDQERADDRLVKAFRVSKKMRPFASRMGMRIDSLDLTDPARASQFERSREEMRSILAKKTIPEAKASRAIAQTLEAAADHQLRSLRQEDAQRDRVRSAGDVGRLIAHLQRLAETIAKLPPISKKTLNPIVTEHTAQFFDTETFAALIYALAEALPKLAPKRRAQDALDAIYKPVAGAIRTSPPELIELWEKMSAETRRQVEQEVRNSAAKRSTTKFLQQLVVALDQFSPHAKPGRLKTIQQRYLESVRKIWTSLGLKIGRANTDNEGKRNSVESSFQRFSRTALVAVGDGTRISARQIANAKQRR